MCLLSVIARLAAWASVHCFARCLCLTFLLCTAVAYPNQTLAADTSGTQSKKIGGNETITGAFGIKFGEDIKPYTRKISQTFGITLMGDTFIRYKILNPPVNLKEMFPDIYNLELLGISDDNDRVILLRFGGLLGERSCVDNNVKAMIEFLREKYKIKTPLAKNGVLFEEYGDSKGNTIQMSCRAGSLDITYTSHLMSDYIARLKAEKQKQKDETTKSLKEAM